jgi:hypothetical protein
MALPNSKDVYNAFLLLLFLCTVLVLFTYIRSVEGFANPETTPEQYDIGLFFKAYPLTEVCPIYTSIYNQLVKGESTDSTGKPLPNDIAEENANKKIGLEITTGPFPCPFEFPTSNNLDTVASYVEKLDTRLLSKAKLTLMFCVVSLQTTLEGAKKAMAQIPKKEGFISECSPEELQYKTIVPLQCIPAETMKATEKQEIDTMDKQTQIQIVAKKQSIAKRLAAIYNDYKQFDVTYAKISNDAISSLKKQVVSAQANADLSEKFAKDSENQTIINAAGNAKEDASIKKSMLERLLKYQQIMGKSIPELIAMSKALQAETTDLQRKLESGNLSF